MGLRSHSANLPIIGAVTQHTGTPFLIAKECVELGLRASAIIFRNVHIEAASASLSAAIAKEVEAARIKVADPKALRALPEVAAFRELLRKVGVNPRKEQPSVERLLSYALKRGDLPSVNNLVDAYNLVSIRSLCSMGAHDLDAITLPVELRLLSGDESFTPLGSVTPASITPGEYGYVDAGKRVLCRLDILQADFSKVTAKTVNAFVIIESTTAHSPAATRSAFSDVTELIQHHCGGTAERIALAY